MESDESDSESVRGPEMERAQSPPDELEEEAAAAEEEADVTDLKHCSVLLNRLQADDKAARKELDEKEDMNRKGGKPVSRIPTFFKRPSGASQSTELPVPKKDTPVQASEPQDDAGCGSAEASKAKPPDVRDMALPVPSVRVPKIGLEAPSLFSSPEKAATTAHSSQIAAPKSWGLSGSVQNPLLTASPRPAIRPEQGSEQHLPEEDESKTSEVEADTVPDVPVRHLLPFASLSQKPQEDTAEKSDVEVEEKITPTASEDSNKSESAEGSHTTEVGQVDVIMDEEAPWEKEPMNILELKDSRSSSDAESEESLADEKSEVHDFEEVKEHHEAHIVQSEFSEVAEERPEMDESTTPVAAGTPADVGSTKSTKSSGCSGFVFLCILPTTLLLLGGFGQHVWHYGLPSSVAQLTAQLELHWLEGFGLVPEPCSTDCRVHLVESIPVGLYPSSPSSRRSIADSWLHLLDRANSSVHIAAFYFTLRGGDLENSDAQGRKVFEHLKQLESKGVKLQIAVNSPQKSTQDTSELAATGTASFDNGPV